MQKYGNMSPNQHFPHAIQAPSHSQTLHQVANDPLSHHLLGKKKKKKKKHHCLESSPCPPKRGHRGRELEGPCVCPGWLSQPDSSLLPVQRSSPRPSSPGSHVPSASPTELWDLTSTLSKISGGSGPDLNAKDNYIICLSPRNATASASLVFPFVPFPNKPRKVIPHSLATKPTHNLSATKPTHNLSATKGAFFTLGD